VRRLVVGDRRLRVRDEGEGKRAPLVCVHGAGSSSVVWMDLVKRVAPHRRVIALDLPGHGQSDAWHEPSIALYRDAVGTACAALGVERALLVGHSMGVAIALACARAWPERVAGLALVCGAADFRVSPRLIAKLEAPQVLTRDVLGPLSFAPECPRELAERWTAVAFEAPAEVAAADLRALVGWDAAPDLPAIAAPSLCVGGADDALVPPKRSLELAAGLRNARAAILPRAGHLAHLEQPDAFHQALDPFLAEIG
jgi:3-oxoadipate enol-lactonase